MASFQELAQMYGQRLANASDKMAEAQRIVAEIKAVVYSTSGKPLTNVDKKRIAALMGSPDGEGIRIRASDNAEYLAMVNYIIDNVVNN